MYKVKKDTKDFLEKVYALACEREPIQGKFDFSTFNGGENPNPPIPNCGTMGCIAGGYFPLIDSGYHFNRLGDFVYGANQIFACESPLFEGNEDLYDACFDMDNQEWFDRRYFNSELELRSLYSGSTKQQVLKNIRTILDAVTVIDND